MAGYLKITSFFWKFSEYYKSPGCAKKTIHSCIWVKNCWDKRHQLQLFGRFIDGNLLLYCFWTLKRYCGALGGTPWAAVSRSVGWFQPIWNRCLSNFRSISPSFEVNFEKNLWTPTSHRYKPDAKNPGQHFHHITSGHTLLEFNRAPERLASQKETSFLMFSNPLFSGATWNFAGVMFRAGVYVRRRPTTANVDPLGILHFGACF